MVANSDSKLDPTAGKTAAGGDEAYSVPEELARERQSIDNFDAALIHILAERFRCTQRVGHIKARYELPPADPKREEKQVMRLRELAKQSGLDPEFAEKFLGFMVNEVIRHHEAIKREYSQKTSI